MKYPVSRSTFSEPLKTAIAKAVAKQVTAQITETDTMIIASVHSQGRPVGRFVLTKEDDTARFTKIQVIERDYYPFEFIVSEVVKYCKKKKIKYIVW